MSGSPFDPGFERLPPTLPIFPLTGVLLLPRGRLPLNIFEPRYLAMINAALGGARMIGMVQPREERASGPRPPVYRTGCAGRITSFDETEDGRYLITLSGVARFDIESELESGLPYREVKSDWQRFRGDLAEEDEATIDRARLLAGLRPFLQRAGIAVEWPSVEATPADRLVNTLAMVCPFAPSEKQALLEASGAAERAQLLTALIEMAVHGAGERPAGGPH
jgi:uncharacterized protein